MKLSKKIKNILISTFMFSVIASTMSGCVYSNNKSWSDMTSEEQQEVKQAYEDVKSELENEFSGDKPEDEIVRYFLNKVQQ